tara:strand:+ start:1169 stop:2398 length:1230 start_codon:yes stop_codon:yes gene_type:complete
MKTFFRHFACTAFILTITSPLLSSAYYSDNNSIEGMNLDELRQTGFRLDWVNKSNSKDLHLPTITDESLYIVDSQDYITRYEKSTGRWVWSSPIGSQTFQLRSISEFKDINRVLIVSDGEIYVVEHNTGNNPSKVDSDKNNAYDKKSIDLTFGANTPAISNGKNQLVYGSKTGDLIWFDPAIGYDINRYSIGNSLNIAPTYAEGIRLKNGLIRQTVVAASENGNVAVVDLNRIKELWSINLMSPTNAPVAYGSNTTLVENEEIPRTSIFIAGTDQYLRSLDLHTGKQRWAYLTNAKLLDSPTVIGKTVYQYVPGIGLAAFDAYPNNLSGKLIWIANDVHGNVITTTSRNKLVCWDASSNKLQIVDPRKGGVMSELNIPNATTLVTESASNGSLYILNDQGAIFRLVPRQ